MAQPRRRADHHTGSQPQGRAEPRPFPRARGCRGRGGSGREFARVMPGRWAGSGSEVCPAPAFLSLYGTRAAGGCPPPRHACLSKHARHAGGDSGGRGAAPPCHCHHLRRGEHLLQEQRGLIHCHDAILALQGQGGESGSSGASCLSHCSRSPLGGKVVGWPRMPPAVSAKGYCRSWRELAPCPGRGCLCLFRDVVPDPFLSR